MSAGSTSRQEEAAMREKWFFRGIALLAFIVVAAVIAVQDSAWPILVFGVAYIAGGASAIKHTVSLERRRG